MDKFLRGDFLDHKGGFQKARETYGRNLFIMMSLEAKNINKTNKRNKSSCSTWRFMSSTSLFYDTCDGNKDEILKRINCFKGHF